MFKVVDNFLPKDMFEKIKVEIEGLTWHYCPITGTANDTSNFYFFHYLYTNDKVSSDRYFHTILMPVLGNLNFKYLHRAKLNLYTKKDKHVKTDYHVDAYIPHTVCLYSLNTCNGYTEFEDGKKVHSRENSMVIFSGHIQHRSINQTDENKRMNLNINLKDVL